MSVTLRTLAADRYAQRRPTVVVEVVATRGSVPREAGTRMLVWDGGLAGTIGGGRLEWGAIATARAMLADDGLQPVDEAIALGASLGQCCGGAVTLRHRRVDAASLAAWPDERVLPTLQVYGAGHVGRAVVRLLETLELRIQWIDERDQGFPAEPSAASVERRSVEPAECEVASAPAGGLYLVLTHRHDLDLRIVEAILRRGDFAFVGLIGSMTKRRRFSRLLAQRGIAADAIERVHCPIGIASIAGKAPAHIAIGVAAQLVPVLEAIGRVTGSAPVQASAAPLDMAQWPPSRKV